MTTSRSHVLIVVESRHGSTLEIAGALAQRLVTHGVSATVSSPHDGPSLEDFDALVVGSAVYLGRWLKPAVAFVDEHCADDTTRPLWLFSSGPLVDDPGDDDGLEGEYISELTERTGARGHHLFAGRLDRSSLGPLETLTATVVHAPTGDFRDWDAVHEWADEIAATLSAPAAG